MFFAKMFEAPWAQYLHSTSATLDFTAGTTSTSRSHVWLLPGIVNLASRSKRNQTPLKNRVKTAGISAILAVGPRVFLLEFFMNRGIGI
jgi:hypothetical protein